MAGPTIYEVADLAGVSAATVSRTLKQPGKVRPDTRQRVQRAIDAVGFIPNAQARNFRRQASDTVILLVRDITNPFYLEIYRGVEEAALEHGYKVLMGDARMDDARIAHYVEMVRERHADGLILMTGRLPKALRDAADRLPPLIVALEYFPDLAFPTVRIDNVAAAGAAVDHLAALGHRRIAHIAGPPEILGHDRQRGYLEGLRRNGLDAAPELLLPGDFSIAAGREAVRQLIGSGTRFTAIFASNDEMAIGAVNELHAQGRRVPADVSVVGFDDIVFAAVAEPSLTTIHQPRRDIGRAAMGLMVDTLAGRPLGTDPILLPAPLMIRGSSGPAPH